MTNEFSKKEIYPSPSKAFSFFLEPIDRIKEEALIVLDANVLLLPFTTDVKNVEAIKSLYEKLVESDQIYLPAQAVREYLDNRANKLANINEALQKKSNQSFNYVGAHPLLSSLEQYQALIELEAPLKEAIKQYQNKIRETLSAVQAWGWNDPVSKMYHEVLSERVLSDEAISTEVVDADLKRRSRLNIPPGYKDKSKEQNQAGDLLIWHELLILAESKDKHVIFVSGDEKADWWHQSGKNPLYPRFELVDEFREKTSGKSFHIVSLSKLLEIFETDREVVESIKSSESEQKIVNEESTAPPPKKLVQRKADSEYRSYLNIPEGHDLLVDHVKWKVKGGYDTDTYEMTELDSEGNVINKYRLYDNTKTTPPFNRELHAIKI
ncbi:PIN domain-containing protein [Photobacterium leiognathi]|uniref:PIN domain-containing protein n=1 Tax=Photobacterium leiognathi TaxID=553611 RepID=UPI0029821CEA|nr:PIN domain-containing protein [Photobacterium leiognathi]